MAIACPLVCGLVKLAVTDISSSFTGTEIGHSEPKKLKIAQSLQYNMNKSSYSLFPSKKKHLYKLSITDMHFCNWIFQLFFCAAVIVPFVTLPALPPIVIYVNI